VGGGEDTRFIDTFRMTQLDTIFSQALTPEGTTPSQTPANRERSYLSGRVVIEAHKGLDSTELQDDYVGSLALRYGATRELWPVLQEWRASNESTQVSDGQLLALLDENVNELVNRLTKKFKKENQNFLLPNIRHSFETGIVSMRKYARRNLSVRLGKLLIGQTEEPIVERSGTIYSADAPLTK